MEGQHLQAALSGVPRLCSFIYHFKYRVQVIKHFVLPVGMPPGVVWSFVSELLGYCKFYPTTHNSANNSNGNPVIISRYLLLFPDRLFRLYLLLHHNA